MKPLHLTFKASIALLLVAALQVGNANTQQEGASSNDDAQVDAGVTGWWEGDVWKNPDRGFNWYPPDRPRAKSPARTPAQKPEPPQKSIKDMTSFEEVEKELNRLKANAVFQPTERNVLEYLKAQEYVLSKSSMFADVARRVAWQNPEVDGNARQPIATYSATNKRERTDSQRRMTMLDISKSHGLVFFFRSDCPFCHDMAPIVKGLSDQYGIQVIAVSMDGGNLPSFPLPRPDNGISRFVSNGEGVRTVPALYLVANDSKTVTLVGVGALAAEEVTERIRVLTTTKPGEEM